MKTYVPSIFLDIVFISHILNFQTLMKKKIKNDYLTKTNVGTSCLRRASYRIINACIDFQDKTFVDAEQI